MKATQPTLVAGSPNTTSGAGRVQTLGTTAREGSITAIGAVFPSGWRYFRAGNAKYLRIVKGLLGTRYSVGATPPLPSHQLVEFLFLYQDEVGPIYRSTWSRLAGQKSDPRYEPVAKESELQEIVRLIGLDSLSEKTA